MHRARLVSRHQLQTRLSPELISVIYVALQSESVTDYDQLPRLIGQRVRAARRDGWATARQGSRWRFNSHGVNTESHFYSTLCPFQLKCMRDRILFSINVNLRLDSILSTSLQQSKLVPWLYHRSGFHLWHISGPLGCSSKFLQNLLSSQQDSWWMNQISLETRTGNISKYSIVIAS